VRFLPALLLVACKTGALPASPAPPKVLHLAAINDFHGALYETRDPRDPDRAIGGLPILAGALDTLRTKHPDLILLDGGDLFQGSWPVNASHGTGSVRAFNLLGVDAAAVGNHEFDYGGSDTHPRRGALQDGARAAEFAWLSANIRAHDGTPWQPEGIAPWTIIERDGISLGVIGLSTQDTPQTTLTKNVSDLVFADPVAAVRDALPAVRAAGADAIAVVGHLVGHCEPASYTEPGAPCHPGGEIGALLDGLPRGSIDVLVVGHAHTLMAHRWQDTFILENRAKGHLIGRLDLVVGPDGVDADASEIHTPWALTHPPLDPGCDGGAYPTAVLDIADRAVTPSAPAVALIAELEASAGSLCDPAGCTARALGRSREAESEAGNLVADAMLTAFESADLAIQNSGGLRADLPSGPLRVEHLQAVMPFENRLLLVEVSGTQLLNILRVGSSGAHGILQVAGATYHFDPQSTVIEDINGDGKAETWETQRLCHATVAGSPIQADNTYRIVTTDFLFEGGDHMGWSFEGTQIIDEGPSLFRHLVDYTTTLDRCWGAAPATPNPRISRGPC
jgi:5'-nucleotidase